MPLHSLLRRSFTVEDIVATAMGRLMLITNQGTTCVTAFQEVRMLLEALPLSEHDFSVATRRLENAQMYFAAGEFGAGKYELRLLMGLLAACL